MTHKEFEHIIPSLRPHLIRVGYDFFGDKAKAEDVSQEVLMRLWLILDRIKDDGRITALAVRMAKNYCVSEYRRQKLRPQAMTDDIKIINVTEGTNAQSLMIEKEKGEKLEHVLKELTPTEQQLIKMRFEEQKEIDEISRETNIKPRSASAMISTARKKLMTIWKKGEKT